MRISFVLALTICLLLAGALPVLAQTPSILLAQEPGGNSEALITLNLSGDLTSTTLALYASQPAGVSTEMKNVRLFMVLSDDNRIPLSTASVQFAPATAITPTDSLLTIPANAKPERVMMTISGVTATGVFTGTILGEVDGKLVPTRTRVEVTHYPAAKIKLVGASVTGLEIRATNPQLERVLYLESTNMGATRLGVQVAHLTGQDGTQVPVRATIGTYPGLSEVELPGLATIPVTVSASLPMSGTYSTAIGLIYGGTRESIPLTITYAPLESHLSIVGTASAGRLELTQRTMELNHDLMIESDNCLTTTMRVQVAPLVGADGVPIPVLAQLNGTTSMEQPIPGLSSSSLNIRASLPISGVYNSAISLIYDGRRETTPLVVTRTRPQPVHVYPVEVVRGEKSLFGPSWGADASLLLTLHESTGITATLNPPTFASLYRKVDQAKYQAVINEIKTYDVVGNTPFSKEITLAPGETRGLRLELSGLNEVGEYNGLLSLSGPDLQPVEQTITIQVREHVLIAIFFIALGIGISWLIRYLSKIVQPRIQQQLKIGTLMTDILAKQRDILELSQDELALLDRFCARLKEQYEKIELGMAEKTDDLIIEIRQKLEVYSDWVNLNRRIQALQSPDLKERFRKVFEPITAGLKANSTLEDCKQFPSRIKTLDGEIAAELQRLFVARLEELRTHIRGRPTKAPELQKQLGDLLESLRPLDEKSKTDIVAAQAILVSVQLNYILALASDLERLVATAPPGFSDAEEWRKMKAAVEEKIRAVRDCKADEADKAVQDYEAGYGIYVKALAEDAHNVMQKEQKHDQALDTIIKLFEAGNAYVQSGEYPQAAGGYNEAIAKFREWKSSRIDRTHAPTLVSEFPDALVNGPVPVALALEQPFDKLAKLEVPDVKTLRNQFTRNEKLIYATIAAIAVLIGVQQLWTDNATWGGPAAYLTALLWGLGLHQAGTVTFDSIAKLGEKITA